MPRPRLRPALREHLLQRLREECEPHGRGREMAAALGCTPEHLSNVLRGTRNLGDQLADRLIVHWGLDPERLDRRLPPDPNALPLNLRAALEFARGEHPPDFMARFEEQARRSVRRSGDRPRRIWLAQVDVAYWEWREAQKAARKASEEGLPLPRDVTESGVMLRSALHGQSVARKKKRKAS